MSDDPLFDALSTLAAKEPGAAIDGRTRRVAQKRLGRAYVRWLGLGLGLMLVVACTAYLVVLFGRAAALY